MLSYNKVKDESKKDVTGNSRDLNRDTVWLYKVVTSQTTKQKFLQEWKTITDVLRGLSKTYKGSGSYSTPRDQR